MNVRGHSGFALQLLNERLIRKSSDRAGSARLKRQIEKQIRFSSECTSPDIRVPPVRAIVETDEGISADMDFVAARDFVQFLTRSGRIQLDDFFVRIMRYVADNLANSTECDVHDAVTSKLQELAERGVPRDYVSRARVLADRAIVVPVGPCHGDLTLSNMLFKGKAIYLLDFLDSYVESPLQDIVKLRQDTRFEWSLGMYSLPFDRTKIRLTLAYLDEKIDRAFGASTWYRSHYPLFQLVNLLRILPYCKDAVTRQHVCASIDQLTAESAPTDLANAQVER